MNDNVITEEEFIVSEAEKYNNLKADIRKPAAKQQNNKEEPQKFDEIKKFCCLHCFNKLSKTFQS